MNSYAVTVADLDLDKDKDIIIGNSGSANTIFWNSGDGQNWTSSALSDETFLTYDIITSDLNNDGLIDIIEANSDDINRYYFNRKKK